MMNKQLQRKQSRSFKAVSDLFLLSKKNTSVVNFKSPYFAYSFSVLCMVSNDSLTLMQFIHAVFTCLCVSKMYTDDAHVYA